MDLPCNKCKKEIKNCQTCIEFDDYIIEIKYFGDNGKDKKEENPSEESNDKKSDKQH